MAKQKQCKQIPLRLRVELRDWLRERSKKTGKSMAFLIRGLIDDQMKLDSPNIKPDYPLSTGTTESCVVGAWFEERHISYMNSLCAAGWSSRVRFISAVIAKERSRTRQQ